VVLAPGDLGRELGARGDVELGEDVREVGLDGPARDGHARPDLGVGQPFGDQARDRALGRGQVMVSTIGVHFTPPFAGPLDAVKAALTALGDTLRQELVLWGVRVVLVEPASINSGAADR
jgi:NAD(P)-dependent dehydrogenase (short-subunit alcohol dehydrogenase family)